MRAKVVLIVGACVGAAIAEEVGDPSNATVVRDLGAPTFVPPPPKPSAPELEVVSTLEQDLGNRVLTVRRVKKPAFAGPVDTPSGATNPNTPPSEEPEESAVNLTVGSTTYRGELTRLIWSHDGQQYSAWSNVDFGLLAAVTSFRSHQVTYNSMILHSKIDLLETEDLPAHPALPTDVAAFVVVEGDDANDDAIDPIMALHEVAVAEESYLTTLAQLREDYQEDRRQWLEANPPTTNNVTISLWKRK